MTTTTTFVNILGNLSFVQTEGTGAPTTGVVPVKKAATVPGIEQPVTAQPNTTGTAAATGAPGTVVVPSTPGPAPAPVGPQKQPGFFDNPLFLIMIFMVGFLLLTSVFGGRKEKKKRAELMASLANGDKVMTMGGIIGTIAELKDDEVVIRTDEGSNTKIRFTRSAVQQIVKKSGSAAGSAGASSSAEAKPAKDTAKV